MIFTAVQLVVSLSVLIFSADRLVVGAANLAKHWRVSPLLIGLTLVSVGTSAPEVVVTLIASLDNNTNMALGSAVGSNITNIALILGLSAILRPLHVEKALIFQQMPYMLLVILLAWPILYFWGFSLASGLILVGLTLGFLALLRYQSHRFSNAIPLHDEKRLSKLTATLWLLLGVILLPISADFFVKSATEFAHYFGVSDLVIGLTIVAIGTSLPELAASIAATFRKEDSIVVGNIVGSNILNLSLVLIPPAFLSNAPLEATAFFRDFPILLALTCLLIGVSFAHHRHGEITRIEGCVLLAFYLGYIGLILT